MNIPSIFPKALFSIFILLIFTSCEDFTKSPYSNITFHRKASLPGIGRSSAVGFAINGKGYVTLGRDNGRGGFLKDCWEYNPTSDTWIPKDSFPGIGRVKAIAAVVNGKAYVGLGFANSNGEVYQNTGYLNDFYRFDPVTNQWKSVERFPSKSTNACVSFVYKNNIYVGSGFDGFGFKADFWKYNPTEDSWTQLSNFPGITRSGAVICTNGERVFFGTGYSSDNERDWWEYFPASDSWSFRNEIPNWGRENGVALAINNQFFISTGRHFGGSLTDGFLYADILEYNPTLNVWYNRGEIPASKRENAIAFTINGKGYVGFGENDQTVLNDFWSFDPQ